MSLESAHSQGSTELILTYFNHWKPQKSASKFINSPSFLSSRNSLNFNNNFTKTIPNRCPLHSLSSTHFDFLQWPKIYWSLNQKDPGGPHINKGRCRWWGGRFEGSRKAKMFGNGRCWFEIGWEKLWLASKDRGGNFSQGKRCNSNGSNWGW